MAQPRRDPVHLGALALLVSVAELGSLSRAASEHLISQPSASARIRQLERQLGLQLLDRSARGSSLTPAGAVVTDHARRVLAALDVLDAAVASLRGQRTAQLRVASSLTLAEHLVPGWLAMLRAREPGVSVGLVVANSRAVLDAVRDELADVGFVEGLRVPSDLEQALIGTDELVVVVAPGHPLASRRRPIGVAELARTPLLLRERGSGTREIFEHALAAHGAKLAAIDELGSTVALLSTARAGVAPAVVSLLAVRDELEAGRLVRVEVADLTLTRRLRAVWPRGRSLSGAARALLAIARRDRARS